MIVSVCVEQEGGGGAADPEEAVGTLGGALEHVTECEVTTVVCGGVTEVEVWIIVCVD